MESEDEFNNLEELTNSRMGNYSSLKVHVLIMENLHETESEQLIKIR